jgi:hypothetical protein
VRGLETVATGRSDGFATDEATVKRRKLADFTQDDQFKPQDGDVEWGIASQAFECQDGFVKQEGMGVVVFAESVEEFGDIVSAVEAAQVAGSWLKPFLELSFGENVEAGRRFADEHYLT